MRFRSTLPAFAVLLPAFSISLPAQTDKLPNIVLIMADDMGYEALGCNGSLDYQTPNLDRLAESGIRFEQCYSQPLCTPSRVKIMTGKYNFRNYVDFEYLSPDQRTFGNLLKEAGYATAIAGKWQLNGLTHDYPGNQDTTRPHHFGFDEYCLWQLNRPKADGERYANPLLIQNGRELPREEDAYGPQIIADFLTGFIDRKADQPFFLYYPMLLPHDPFVPTPDSPQWKDPSRRYEHDPRYFGDMIAYIDKIIGQIEAKLREKGLWENTLLIFTADNGTHGSIKTRTRSGMVQGAKGQTINTGNHVPMVVSWPDKITEGRVFTGLIDFADFLPTLCEVAGIDPAVYASDGKSFLKVLLGEAHRPDKEEIFIHYTPRWGKRAHSRWVMNSAYKLYRDGRFFNTLKDPGETAVLADPPGQEKAVRDHFDKILSKMEDLHPFDQNDKKFKY